MVIDITKKIKNSKELKNTAFELLDQLPKEATEQNGGAMMLALIGPLGAGKTSLTQALGEALGVEQPITSPTFVLRKKYQTTNSYFDQLIHYDCYRLDDPGELRELGWQKDVERFGNLICLEWADRVPNIWPVNTWRVEMLVNGEEERTIRVKRDSQEGGGRL